MLLYVLLFVCIHGDKLDTDLFVYSSEKSCQAAKNRAMVELPKVCQQFAADCLIKKVLEPNRSPDTSPGSKDVKKLL